MIAKPQHIFITRQCLQLPFQLKPPPRSSRAYQGTSLRVGLTLQARLLMLKPSLLTSGKYSDLLLECNSHSWQVHKFVLCTQSSFFTKACEGDTWEVRDDITVLSFVEYPANAATRRRRIVK